jgi:hypothetical protein
MRIPKLLKIPEATMLRIASNQVTTFSQIDYVIHDLFAESKYYESNGQLFFSIGLDSMMFETPGHRLEAKKAQHVHISFTIVDKITTKETTGIANTFSEFCEMLEPLFPKE